MCKHAHFHIGPSIIKGRPYQPKALAYSRYGSRDDARANMERHVINYLSHIKVLRRKKINKTLIFNNFKYLNENEIVFWY